MWMLADERESTDAKILRLAQEGKRREAGRVLIEAYGREITGTCISRMGCRESGQDAAQDAFARALVALDNYRGTGGLRPWLHRIASNRCIDLIRSRRSRLVRRADGADLEGIAAPGGPMPVEVAEATHDRNTQLATVRDVLAAVKEPDRTWLEMHYTHGVSYDVIAEEAGLTRAAVKQRIWRAVKRVRTGLLRAEGEQA
jgi:RNA polymerase sigma-70 factor (ECF subfamily)